MSLNDVVYQISSFYKSRDKEDHREEVWQLYDAIENYDEEYNSMPLTYYIAKHGDYDSLKKLLAKGISIPTKDHNGYTILHQIVYGDSRDYCSWADEYKLVMLLLDNGVSILRKSDDGMNALLIAAQRGKRDFIKAVIDAGKKLDFVSQDGESALHFACDYAQREAGSFHKYDKPAYEKIMNEVIDESNEVLVRIHKDHLKSQKEHYERSLKKMNDAIEILQLLIDAGLDPDQKDNYGHTAKEIAFASLEVRIPAILNGVDADDSMEAKTKGMNMMQAIAKEDVEAVASLLQLGSDPNEFYGESYYVDSIDLEGKLPLSFACMKLNIDIIKLLLEANADPNLKDSNDKVPLTYPLTSYKSVSGNVYENKVIPQLFKLMKEHGFDFNQVINDTGDTLLTLTCRNVDRASGYNNYTFEGVFIEELFKQKVDVNKCDLNGVTALMSVCLGESRYMEDILLSLLEADADMKLKDSDGNTALMYAAKNANHSNAKAFVDLLFEFGEPDVNEVNNEGKNALAYATENNNENLVQYLLMKI
ncbi:ankyrin repeat protein [Breznakia sp. PF5-3]|uniref:ankyrin repeat domain-containing protein n=1 Tax=unclassified Breznakia TaxID=2623764 RepID=UPI002406C3A3|nr:MULTISPECIES: ankyrin repeat domain-containing protein [unclassified Breznakia]MDL2276730.1 ankyrin repeat domain-containing protein [Breznakia sp. OttesenSCG-928-G09]MDF9825811.1 ankyrin repeat protein [Breznakia sp. PM6-1]MDF9836616.1 ankyrin repeat protein [Breznakia sp. PF5-3]MDF9838861.1 ankyrin repeat protein [Breznakia sp. PFB2-8]MDF9860887.1 ankyrin repeat protein [Breznakia sp. PH5-24]